MDGERATRANADNEKVQAEETRLYLLQHDNELWYIEANSMPEAIAVWHEAVKIEWGYQYDPEDEPDSCALLHIGYPAVYRRGVTIDGSRGETVIDVNALAGQVIDLCNAHNAGPQGDYVIDETVRPKLVALLVGAMMTDAPHPALHASAPDEDYKCADCAMDREPCLSCYEAWWRRRHPNVTILPLGRATGDELAGHHADTLQLQRMARGQYPTQPRQTRTLAELTVAVALQEQNRVVELLNKASYPCRWTDEGFIVPGDVQTVLVAKES